MQLRPNPETYGRSRSRALRRTGVLLFLLGLGCSTPASPAMIEGNGTTIPPDGSGFVHRAGKTIVDPSGSPLLLRCVNVDSWLLPVPYLVSDSGDALLSSPSEFAGRLTEVVGAERAATFWSDWRERFITERDFERMAALGFNCARVVLYHRAITTDAGVLDDDNLAHVDRAVDWGRTHGVYLVLDLHSAPGGQNILSTVSDVPRGQMTTGLWEGPDAAENQDATVAIWAALAARYAGRTAVAGYDLLNEPVLPAAVDSAALPALMTRIAAAIREVDGGHLLFVEGDKLAHDFDAFDAPLDENMAYSFHAYALTGFEDWASPSVDVLQPYLDLREEHERPLWLGEWGENNKEWHASMTGLMKANDIGWAVYPWKRKQTLFWNPVLQRIAPTPSWYALANYLAAPPSSTVEKPDAERAEEGMREILSAIELANCTEDAELAVALVR